MNNEIDANRLNNLADVMLEKMELGENYADHYCNNQLEDAIEDSLLIIEDYKDKKEEFKNKDFIDYVFHNINLLNKRKMNNEIDAYNKVGYDSKNHDNDDEEESEEQLEMEAQQAQQRRENEELRKLRLVEKEQLEIEAQQRREIEILRGLQIQIQQKEQEIEGKKPFMSHMERLKLLKKNRREAIPGRREQRKRLNHLNQEHFLPTKQPQHYMSHSERHKILKKNRKKGLAGRRKKRKNQ